MTDRATPTNRRSQGQIVVARGLWYVKPGIAEIRTERLGPLLPGQVRIATHFSCLSRGTERLVARGEVPEGEWGRMRAPMQAGNFPFPVKYGYATAGLVMAGPEHLCGKRVFALHPHQDYLQVAEEQLHFVPDDVPLRRATLAANMETALNAHWDAGTAPGDRVLVVGAGIVGLLVAHLARRIAGVEVTITDLDLAKSQFALALGVRFTAPADAPRGNNVVFHTSATSKGLQAAIATAGFEGKIIELSWYGSGASTIELGGSFHSQRLQIVCSQVGHVAPSHRASVSRAQRLTTALRLLNDPALDALVVDDIPFEAATGELARIFSDTYSGAAPVLRYTEAKE